MQGDYENYSRRKIDSISMDQRAGCSDEKDLIELKAHKMNGLNVSPWSTAQNKLSVKVLNH